jgi:hypothetical protein
VRIASLRELFNRIEKSMKMNEEKKSRIEIGLSVSDRIQLLHVCVVEGSFRRNLGIDAPEPLIKQRRSVEASIDESSGRLRVMTRFFLEAVPSNVEGENSLMEIEARFLLTYAVNSMEGLTKEHFDAFAEHNGIFNVWPYWREYVQSATLRMGLPALTVPVYRIGAKRPQIEARNIEVPAANTGLPSGPDQSTKLES